MADNPRRVIVCHSKLEGRGFKMHVDDVASNTSIYDEVRETT